MAYGLFEDLDKKPKDLLKKGYAFNRKITTKNTTGNGVTFETEHCIGAKDITGKVTAKFALTDNVKVDKIDITSAGNLGVKFSLNNFVDGLSVSVDAKTGVVNSSGGDAAKIAAEYRADAFSFNGSIDAVKGCGSLALLTGYDAFSAGGSVSYDAKKAGELSAFELAGAYANKDFSVAVRATDKLSKYNVHVHQQCSDRLVCAIAASVTRAGNMGLTVGGKLTVDRDTSLQGKIDTKGTVSLSYIQRLNDFVTLTASSEVDGKTLSSKAVGMQLAFA